MDEVVAGVDVVVRREYPVSLSVTELGVVELHVGSLFQARVVISNDMAVFCDLQI